LALATMTVAVALLVVRLGTMFVAVAVAVSAIFVPEGVPAFTCKISVKVTGVLSAKLLPSLQEMRPVPPTVGFVLQVQPAGAVMDWKFVFGGVVWLKVAPVAVAGPRLFTVWV
jgi:hypothetical protein